MTSEYLNALLASEKYAPDRQLILKERAFTTFDNLLKFAGLPGLLPNNRLLDLGSADGALVKTARRHGLQAHGLDVTDNIDFEHDRLPYEEAVFDVITAVSLIEHLRSPSLMLKESMRVLKPGGGLIIVTPNWRHSYRIFFDDPTHVHPYSDRSIGFLLRGAGFGPVVVVPWLVCKPAWMWSVPFAFELARLLPFRWSPNRIIPEILKGKSKSILALAVKPPQRRAA
jgi:SAM-dependent methyltransferase